MATSTGTDRYRERFEDEFGARYFQALDDWSLSSVGAGTYLGDPTDDVDAQYHEALVTALESGINVIDTAINYRCQRSERVVGRAVADAAVDRDEVLVTTKGGYLPFDGSPPEDVDAYVQSTFVEPGLVDPEDLATGLHCLSPEFIEHQLDRSLTNLGLETIDLYYLHNPETQLEARSHSEVYDQIEAAFTRLEKRVAAGDIRRYGLATWEAFRVSADAEPYLSLPEILSRARAAAEAAGHSQTHLGALQIPFNPLMAEVFTVRAHGADEDRTNALDFARDAGLSVFASATLAQGEVVEKMPDEVAVWFHGDTTVQRAINFARSAPAVTCALVGMRSTAHVEENVAAGTFDRMGSDAFDVVFEGPAQAADEPDAH